ncbi:MAG: MATE family efflux transporter [bacterium]|nr:MATE family efflux transporter [bacterium]
MQSVFMLVDSLFVARLGAEAMAVVGLTAVVFALVLTLAHGLGEATTATVARRIGEKRPAAAAKAAAQALVLGSTVAIVVGFAGWVNAWRILAWMGASAGVRDTGTIYTEITLGGAITLFFVLIGNCALRGAGDANLALRSLWLANGLNIVLDPLLIFGWGPFPELGLTGAALASVIGWGIAGCYQIWILASGHSRLRIRAGDLAPDFAILGGLMRIGLPASLNNVLGSASYLLLFRIVAIFGSSALAAFTICTRLFLLAEAPSWGLSNASAALVGQNLGAGRGRRAERTAWRVGYYNMLSQGAIGVSFMVFAEPLMRLFSQDPEVIELGKQCLIWVSAGYMLYGYGNVIGQSFSGAGDTVTPAVVNAGSMWLGQIPLAYVLAVTLGIGPLGVFLALLISESLLAIVMIAMFRRGKWKGKRV